METIKEIEVEIKDLEKQVALAQIEILISLAEHRENTYDIMKLGQIKEYILKQ
jgi:hypothetical protein